MPPPMINSPGSSMPHTVPNGVIHPRPSVTFAINGARSRYAATPIIAIVEPMAMRNIMMETCGADFGFMSGEKEILLGTRTGWSAVLLAARHFFDHVVQNEEHARVLDHRHHGSSCGSVTDENRKRGPTDDSGKRSEDAHLTKTAHLARRERKTSEDHECGNDVSEDSGSHSKGRNRRKDALGHADESFEVTVVIYAVCDEHETEGDAWEPKNMLAWARLNGATARSASRRSTATHRKRGEEKK